MSSAEKESRIVFGISRKSLEATVIHACPHCGAPGVFRDDDRTRINWPGCWSRKYINRPVGSICPNCHKYRRKDHDLGELTASMPRWLWRCILGVKWCAIKLRGER